MSGQIEGRQVEIEVRDYGSWRDPREGDHGRGLALMEALMDSVDVTPTPEGTTVRLRRTLTPPNSNGDQA
jgi:anti-sigma regulatory factor (Ser/Thr protein kinase)